MMVEFAGYISGEAEKYFVRRTRKSSTCALLVGFVFCVPVAISFAIALNYWVFALMPIGALCGLPVIFMSPSKKKLKKILPNKIFTDGETVVCNFEIGTSSRYILDVKKVRDYGEFYELVFPLGNLGNSYICQKDLLTKGSLDEFEALFSDKIERVKRQGDGSPVS